MLTQLLPLAKEKSSPRLANSAALHVSPTPRAQERKDPRKNKKKRNKTGREGGKRREGLREGGREGGKGGKGEREGEANQRIQKKQFGKEQKNNVRSRQETPLKTVSHNTHTNHAPPHHDARTQRKSQDTNTKRDGWIRSARG